MRKPISLCFTGIHSGHGKYMPSFNRRLKVWVNLRDLDVQRKKKNKFSSTEVGCVYFALNNEQWRCFCTRRRTVRIRGRPTSWMVITFPRRFLHHGVQLLLATFSANEDYLFPILYSFTFIISFRRNYTGHNSGRFYLKWQSRAIYLCHVLNCSTGIFF
jgi:hypothetical protein